MRRCRVRERLEVITTFESRDNAATAAFAGYVAQGSGYPREIAFVEREVGERIDAAVAGAKAAPYPDPRDERATEFAA